MTRSIIAIAAVLLSVDSAAAPQSTPPPFVTRNAPGKAHAALAKLAGTWRVRMENFGIGGAQRHVVSDDIIARRQTVGGGKWLREETTGTFDGTPYWRMGMLGYSNLDRRYEWVTQDGLNTMMMIYQGARSSGPGFPIEMVGTFTDSGLLGEASVGRRIRQRTEIIVQGPNRHVFNLYFTPPGGRERLFDRKTYTRISR
jgi:hypothetical protein